jgi:hypothetical protein
MSTAEMKQHVIQRIQSLENDNVLQEIESLLSFYDDGEIFVLSEQQKASIDQGLKDIAEGRFITDEEANKEIEEWLKE